eukprot:6196432-Pleurochrysis_carterae.AAC.1
MYANRYGAYRALPCAIAAAADARGARAIEDRLKELHPLLCEPVAMRFSHVTASTAPRKSLSRRYAPRERCANRTSNKPDKHVRRAVKGHESNKTRGRRQPIEVNQSAA